jgi:hypothetical protein
VTPRRAASRRITAVIAVATLVLAGCGRLTMPIAESSSLSVVVGGDPGFVSFGGSRWEASLQSAGGIVIKTWEPDATIAIDITPGDYRLVISAVPLGDAIMCNVTDANPVPDPKSCTRQEGPAQEVCVIRSRSSRSRTLPCATRLSTGRLATWTRRDRGTIAASRPAPGASLAGGVRLAVDRRLRRDAPARIR